MYNKNHDLKRISAMLRVELPQAPSSANINLNEIINVL